MKKRFLKAFTCWKPRESRQFTCFENKFLECPYLDNRNDIKAFVQCQKHEKQFLYYCCSHVVLCCDQCIKEGHRGCEKEEISNGTEQKKTVDILYWRYMNLREYSLELSSQIAGLVTTDELLESFRCTERDGNIQQDLRKKLIECSMFEAECLNLLRLFNLSPSHSDRLILQKNIAVLDERICKCLRGVSKFTPEKYTQKSLCVWGNTVQNAPKKGQLGAVILDTADTDITNRYVKDLKERLENKNIYVAYAGTLTGFKKDESLPLLVVCSWDTRLEQDVKASLTRVQGYGLHRVGLLVLCLKGDHIKTSADKNPDLGYLSYISCISGPCEISKKQLNEIRSFLTEQKASGTPV